MIKLVCDLGGGDKSPIELIDGVINAVNLNNDLEVIVFTNLNEINSYVKENKNDRIHFIDASDVITNYDNPTQAFKEKPNSSLVKALTYLNENDDYSGFVSVGSTGAVLVSSIMSLGRINGCRPALASLLPNNKSFFCLVDCGANIDCKPEHLMGFAKMGSAFIKAYFNNPNPKVGLISNGSEEKKGNALTKEVHQLLKESNLNFIGNIEGTNVLTGACDVLVCDGFDGNIILKNIEGTAKTIIKQIYIEKEQSTDFEEKKALDKLIKNLMNKYDFNSLGGATLLGVNKVVVKAHGAGNSTTITNTLNQAYTLAKNKLIEKVNSEISGE